MSTSVQQNKEIVKRFNQELIEEWHPATADEIFHDAFINHTAAPPFDNGKGGVLKMFNEILRPALSDIKVTIHEQIAEGDLVTTRKTISGKHTGVWWGIEPTQNDVAISVIDIVRIRDGKYFEHWGVNTLQVVLQSLKVI